MMMNEEADVLVREWKGDAEEKKNVERKKIDISVTGERTLSMWVSPKERGLGNK